MIIGVWSYSFAIGSLSSLMSSFDSKEAKLKEKMDVLEGLSQDYKLNYDTYLKMKKALKYDHSKNVSDKHNF